jgi:hypothetical protein
MDTNDNIEPVGGGDVTPSQDTSTDIAQPSEAEVVDNGNESVEEGEASELLAGKYKNQDELIKGYKELEGKIGEIGQKASLINKLEQTTGMNSQQIAEYLDRQEQEQMAQQIQANPGLAAFQEVQSLKNQLALQAEEKELDKFLGSEEGKAYTPFKDKIFDLALNLYNGKVRDNKPYQEIAKEYFGESRAQGQQDAYKKIENKQNTQATGSMSQTKRKLSDEDMDRMSAAELEAILPHADTSQRLY